MRPADEVAAIPGKEAFVTHIQGDGQMLAAVFISHPTALVAGEESLDGLATALKFKGPAAALLEIVRID